MFSFVLWSAGFFPGLGGMPIINRLRKKTFYGNKVLDQERGG